MCSSSRERGASSPGRVLYGEGYGSFSGAFRAFAVAHHLVEFRCVIRFHYQSKIGMGLLAASSYVLSLLLARSATTGCFPTLGSEVAFSR